VDIEEDDVLELHLWLPPTENRKRGFFAVIAGGKVIRKGPNPYRHRQIPYVHFTGEKTPGKTHGFSSGQQALPEIRLYNEQKSRVVEIARTMSKPPWLVPNSARIPKRTIVSEPGLIIRYAGINPPTPAKMPEVPRIFSELMLTSIRDIDELTAQREPTRGINPPGGRSAAVVQTLQATDEGSLNIIGTTLDTGISTVGRLMLSVVDQFMTEDRIISYVGEKNKHIAFTFKSNSLTGKNF